MTVIFLLLKWTTINDIHLEDDNKSNCCQSVINIDVSTQNKKNKVSVLFKWELSSWVWFHKKNCSNEGILCQAVIAKKKNIVMTNLRTACLCTVLLSWSLSASVNLSAMDSDDSELCCIIWWVLLITLSSVFWSTTACHSTQIQQLV